MVQQETNVCFAYRFHPASPELNDFIQLPIGQPLPDMYASIIDEQGHTSEVCREQENGEQGELLVEGIGVTPGYSNLIDPKNSEHHRHHRHATGDIVHCEQGLYYFHGRVDDMVKLKWSSGRAG
ncbi:AMP-binding protein [Vibrio sp. PP-XX7]